MIKASDPSLPIPIGYFVSAHGFGHASRAAAVMESIHELLPTVRFHIITTIPAWFFSDSLGNGFQHHAYQTDIGLIQKGPLEEDIPATIEALNEFFPLRPAQTDPLCRLMAQTGCRMIISDISPLGIHVAGQIGLPSILVENFTWDWIYEAYRDQTSGFQGHVGYLQGLFQQADFHVQTEPVCRKQISDLCAAPISRGNRTSRKEVRQRLGIPDEMPAILITMGGVRGRMDFLDQFGQRPDVCFVVPGGADSTKKIGNMVCLPHHSDFFHPDLVQAVDGVVGKAGYSTIAEVYQAGVPFGFIARPRFRESEKLVEFIEKNIHGVSIEPAEFQCGSWVARLDDLLSLPRIAKKRANGARQVADFVIGHLPDGRSYP